MGQLTRELARTADATRVARLLSDGIDQVGGLRNFADLFRDHFDAVSRTNHGSRETLNALIAIANLSVASATLNPPPDPNLMQDDELHEYTETLLHQAFAERIERLLLAGWTIQPPTDIEHPLTPEVATPLC